MEGQHPDPTSSGVTSIVLGIILTLITCGIYGLYWQYKQMRTLNLWLGRDDYRFLLWFLLGIITCGIFAIYYEYKMAKGINEIQAHQALPVSTDLGVICVLLAIFGAGVASLAVQQYEINKFYDVHSDY